MQLVVWFGRVGKKQENKRLLYSKKALLKENKQIHET